MGRALGDPSWRAVHPTTTDRREIEVVRREQDGSWSRHVTKAGGRARLAAFEIDLSVDEVYRDPLAMA